MKQVRTLVKEQPSRETDGLQAASALAATWWLMIQERSSSEINLARNNRFASRLRGGLAELREEFGMGSWAVRIAFNNLFGGVIIQQQPGEGNRLHCHPDADEC